MNNIKTISKLRLVMAIALALFGMSAYSQNGGTYSSYSRFGIGLLNDQSQTWNRAMGGVGVALPSGSKLNTMNPASYAHIDSLSFILDAGLSGNFGQMSMAGRSKNVNNATFDYIAAGFRLRKGLAISFGFRPYSTVGYNYTTTSDEVYRNEITGEVVRNTTNYQGKGGINQVFVGLGWKPFANFSIGANASILWGGYDHIMMQEFTENGSSSTNFDGFNFIQHADVLTYKLDFGAQYAFRVSRRDWLTLGATVGLGHEFDGEAFLYRFMTTGDTLTVDGEKNGFDIPMSYAGGIAWQHKNTLLVSADVHYDTWGDCRVPVMAINNGNVTYPSIGNMYQNRYSLNAGVEYTPDPMASKGYYKRIKYRVGASYSSPYMNIPQADGKLATTIEGPSEMGVSLGVGLPILVRRNNRSMVNLGAQWLRRAPSSQNLITENYFILSLGVTFNEPWFMKFKIQ